MENIRDKIASLIHKNAGLFEEIEYAPIDDLLYRIGDSRIILLGEATHGSSEFYKMRAKITRELIEKKHFNLIAIEADWPDVATVNRYACHQPKYAPWGLSENKPFLRFPRWMWRNQEFHDFTEWLRHHNHSRYPKERVEIFGLDIYNLEETFDIIENSLAHISPELKKIAAQYYEGLKRWANNPIQYGLALRLKSIPSCEKDVQKMLDILEEKKTQSLFDNSRLYFEVLQNARSVVSAERYYHAIYEPDPIPWNIRDKHMFETLKELLKFKGENAKVVVWAHNSHIGNAAATSLGHNGQWNLGQLCKEEMETSAYLVGFGTDHGIVAAASDWGGPMELKRIKPSHLNSYEKIFHESGLPSFHLPLNRKSIRKELYSPKLERAIGVIYSPETEFTSHYFEAILPEQFDEYIWFDKTSPITPLDSLPAKEGTSETYPFGL